METAWEATDVVASMDTVAVDVTAVMTAAVTGAASARFSVLAGKDASVVTASLAAGAASLSASSSTAVSATSAAAVAPSEPVALSFAAVKSTADSCSSNITVSDDVLASSSEMYT